MLAYKDISFGHRISPTPYTCLLRLCSDDGDRSSTNSASKAVEFAIEAVETWHDEVLGISWAELSAGHGLRPEFVRLACDWRRSLPKDQVLRMRVQVGNVASSHISFTIIAEIDLQEVCFEAMVELCFVQPKSLTRIPLPVHYRKRLDQIIGLLK